MTTKTADTSRQAGPGETRTFDESLRLLETIVRQLESGELPLERALDLFEQGIGLARHCQSQLEAAERRVEVLLQEKGGTVRLAPYEPEASSRVDATAARHIGRQQREPIPLAEEDLDDEDVDEEEEDEDSDLPF